MRVRDICVGLALLLFISRGIAQGAGLSVEQQLALDKLINATMSAEEVPGLTVAIALHGELRWTAGYGFADLENFVPATARTRIRTASITKWMTATAAMRLVEEGKLDLEAAPQQYCKAYPRKRWPMKVRQLLNHTAGVRHYHGSNDEPQNTQAERDAVAQKRSRERAGQFTRYTDVTRPLDAFKDDPLIFEPGTRYDYTSHGYRLLGCVLEGAAGESYSALMARVVFNPAQMRDTVVDDAWEIVPHRAAGYSGGPDGHLRRADFRDISENLPAGGHLSTAADLVAFALAFNSRQLVSEQTVQRMLQFASVPRNDDPTKYYGFGVRVRTGSHGLTLSHAGAQPGTSTCLLTQPEVGFAVAVMMNKDEVAADTLCESLWNALGG